MPKPTRNSLTADDVLLRVREELSTPQPPTSPMARRIATIRDLQRSFREQPIGGRLVPMKRVLFWFTASAFDRQAKVIEALLEVLEEVAERNEELEHRLAHSMSSGTTTRPTL